MWSLVALRFNCSWMLSGLASSFKFAECMCRWAVVAWHCMLYCVACSIIVLLGLLGGLAVLARKSSGSGLGCKTKVQGRFYAVDYFVCHGLNQPAHQHNVGSATLLINSYQTVAIWASFETDHFTLGCWLIITSCKLIIVLVSWRIGSRRNWPNCNSDLIKKCRHCTRH